MGTTSRRDFVSKTSLTAGGVLFLAPLIAKERSSSDNIVGCAPSAPRVFSGSAQSVQSGLWSDPASWGGKIPGRSDIVVISPGHEIVIDVNAVVSGVNISNESRLAFDTAKSCTLESSGNIVVEGILKMHPSVNSRHAITFIGIKESNFVGGGMDVMSSDVGLWVMANGHLDLVGSEKKSWTRAAHTIPGGAVSVQLETTADGWKTGDEMVITPTESPKSFDPILGFELRRITNNSGSTISFDKPVSRAHPKINERWTAEVLNVTRNAVIEGTPDGRAHIFIRSSSAQTIKNVEMKYLGPRKDINKDKNSEIVKGRYALHFHHCLDGSRNSIVANCVVRDCGNHSYVPHGSHGILFTNNIAYNVFETAFWWDPRDISHDIIYDSNIVALGKYVNNSLEVMDDNDDGPVATISVSGFLLGMGDNNQCTNNVVTGLQEGDPANGGAFEWRANNEGIWKFENNLAHHNTSGIFVWQVTVKSHIVRNFEAYYNWGHAIFHGAYGNVYKYVGGHLFANNIVIKASSLNSSRIRVEEMTIDGNNEIDYCVESRSSELGAAAPLLLRNLKMSGFKKNPVYLISTMFDSGSKNLKFLDMVHCSFNGQPVIDMSSHAEELIRVQHADGAAYKITKSGKQDIEPFAPVYWGNGIGLRGEYFSDHNMEQHAFVSIDPLVSFNDWYDSGNGKVSVHYKIASNNKIFSARWKGMIHAQFSEEYLFMVQCSGHHKLTIGNTVVIDGNKQGRIVLEADKKYPIEMEFRNVPEYMVSEGGAAANLYWKSPSLEKFSPGGEFVPQSQLYPDEAGPLVKEETVNKSPIANAGADIVVVLPVNATSLKSVGSVDSDGAIVSYEWKKISGPGQFYIENPHAPSTEVNNLAEGTYIFRLKVTDNQGSIGEDEVAVVVRAAETIHSEPVPALNITANPNPSSHNFQLTLSSNSTMAIQLKILNRFGWPVATYSSLSPGSSVTVGTFLRKGTYYAVAEQGFQKKVITLLKM